nr:FtsX-like permease family protein [Adhaeribacter aquaticus]
MNLSTARSSLRAKEIGVRKVLGAYKRNLIWQFLSESLLFTFLAILLALLLARLAMPLMNLLTGKELSLAFDNTWLFGLGVLGLAVLVGLVAGSYPALFLSGFQPVQVLKGKLNVGTSAVSLRKVLVVLQFSISVILIICTGMVYKQLNFLHNKALGLNKDHIITLPYSDEMHEKYDAFRSELTKYTGVLEVGRSVGVPSDRLLNSHGNLKINKGDSIVPSPLSFQYLSIDHKFIDTYNIKLVAGRNFSKAYPTDDSMAFMLNESAVKLLGFASPEEAIGRSMEYGPRKGKLVGVLQDFHFESMHEQIKPLVFQVGQRYTRASVKANKEHIPQALAHIEKTWHQFLPGRPFDYQFLDESFGQLYEAEQRQGKLFLLFAGMAILIACLGLFGLASFATEQRTKEIGIRKVLGATVSGLVGMLSKDLLKLVLVANLLAWPLAWYGMEKWLQDFAYRTTISWWVFGVAGLLALFIALMTVSFHAFKAAMANPVKSLNCE